MPPNLKNGKCSYKNVDKGFLKMKARTTDKINPSADINCLNTPCLKPRKQPNKMITMINKSTMFKKIKSLL